MFPQLSDKLQDIFKELRGHGTLSEANIDAALRQQIVKIFHDELTALLGGDAARLRLADDDRILIVGLNGSGKTTSSAKLARFLQTQGHRPALVPCDLQRPA